MVTHSLAQSADQRATRFPGRRGAGPNRLIRFVLKPAVFMLCLAPLGWLGWLATSGGLGVNPIETANRFLGDWALRFLLISLAVSPVKKIFGCALVMRFRRMLGLFAFFYVVLHFSSYVGLDQFFAWAHIGADIVKRPYITVGMTTFLLLVPLAATSTSGMVKRLGAKRWKRLHMLVYAAAALAVFHYFMMVKADVREPLIYGGVLALLLGWRAVARWPRTRPTGIVPAAEGLAAPSRIRGTIG
jgi:methionine sulfoxide reductase heme-binding subunit